MLLLGQRHRLEHDRRGRPRRLRELHGQRARAPHHGVRLLSRRQRDPAGHTRVDRRRGTATSAWASRSPRTRIAGSGCSARRRPSCGWTTGRSPATRRTPRRRTPSSTTRCRRRAHLANVDYIGYHTGGKDIEAKAREAGMEMLDDFVFFTTPSSWRTMKDGEVNDGAGPHGRDLEQGEGRPRVPGTEAAPRLGGRRRPRRGSLAADCSSSRRSPRWSGYSFGYKPGLLGTHANDVLSFDRYCRGCLDPTFFDDLRPTLWDRRSSAPRSAWSSRSRSPTGWRSRRHRIGAACCSPSSSIPFWTNFLVRTIGWQIILAPQGCRLELGACSRWVWTSSCTCSYTRQAVQIGVVYNYLPLMILPLFVALDRVGASLREASKDLGANRCADVLRVTFPLARARHHRRRAAGLHPPDGRLHHRHGARRGEGQHGRASWWRASSRPRRTGRSARRWRSC